MQINKINQTTNKKKVTKQLKEESGITLIALVLTIIILLILAMISLMVVQSSGLLGRSKGAREKWNESEEKEQLDVAVQEARLTQPSKEDASDYVGRLTFNKVRDAIVNQSWKQEDIEQVEINGRDAAKAIAPSKRIYYVYLDTGEVVPYVESKEMKEVKSIVAKFITNGKVNYSNLNNALSEEGFQNAKDGENNIDGIYYSSSNNTQYIVYPDGNVEDISGKYTFTINQMIDKLMQSAYIQPDGGTSMLSPDDFWSINSFFPASKDVKKGVKRVTWEDDGDFASDAYNVKLICPNNKINYYNANEIDNNNKIKENDVILSFYSNVTIANNALYDTNNDYVEIFLKQENEDIGPDGLLCDSIKRYKSDDPEEQKIGNDQIQQWKKLYGDIIVIISK